MNCEPRDANSSRICHVLDPGPAKRLEPGQQTSAVVDARCRWNRTGVSLAQGAAYGLIVSPLEPWSDDGIEADVDTGWREHRWRASIFQWFARAPGLPLYSLVAAHGMNDKDIQPAGPASTVESRIAPEGVATELFLFANDAPGYYHNNQGCLVVTIRRLR